MGKPTVNDPDRLTSMDISFIGDFLKSYGLYKEQGGKKGPGSFIDESILETIKEFELNDINAPISAVMAYLGK